MAINAEILKKRTFDFALTTFKAIDKLPKSIANEVMGKQLTRSASSVGANYRAACNAKSSPDFINKLKIVEEECDETMYFIELLIELNPKDKTELLKIHTEANELLSIVVASIKTARKNNLNKN